MCDNTPAKFITVRPWHHDEPELLILCRVNANSNRLLEKFEPHSSFRFQYRLLTMTIVFEIAVYTDQNTEITSKGHRFNVPVNGSCGERSLRIYSTS